MKTIKTTVFFAAASLSAVSATFNLGERMAADVAPDGSVTFRAGEATR